MEVQLLMLEKEAERQECGNGGAIWEVGWYWVYIRAKKFDSYANYIHVNDM